MYMIAPILALFCAIGTKCKVTAKIAVTKRKIHLFFTENKKRVISTNFREKSATPAMWRCVISTAFLPTLGYRPHTVYTVDHQ
jgi:hypothetical protein